jgi:dihydrofolate reductase
MGVCAIQLAKERTLMRKIILLIHLSLDGYMAGPNDEMDWITYNSDLERYSHDMTKTADATIFGRRTYYGMESFWPTVPGNPASSPSEIAYANWLNKATKIVLSRTLQGSQWENTVIIHDNAAEEIAKIKGQPGQNILMFGSGEAAQMLMQHNLIDEYRINVNPVVLGKGKPLFGNTRLKLKLLGAQSFPGGVAALRYEPEQR